MKYLRDLGIFIMTAAMMLGRMYQVERPGWSWTCNCTKYQNAWSDDNDHADDVDYERSPLDWPNKNIKVHDRMMNLSWSQHLTAVVVVHDDDDDDDDAHPPFYSGEAYRQPGISPPRFPSGEKLKSTLWSWNHQHHHRHLSYMRQRHPHTSHVPRSLTQYHREC